MCVSVTFWSHTGCHLTTHWGCLPAIILHLISVENLPAAPGLILPNVRQRSCLNIKLEKKEKTCQITGVLLFEIH